MTKPILINTIAIAVLAAALVVLGKDIEAVHILLLLPGIAYFGSKLLKEYKSKKE